MTIMELKNEADRFRAEGISPIPLITQINEKIALAFSCFIFVLLGSSLAIITRRRQKSVNFGMAFIIVGIYYLLLMAAEALSLQGYLEPILAMWLPNIIFGLIGTILTFRVCAY